MRSYVEQFSHPIGVRRLRNASSFSNLFSGRGAARAVVATSYNASHRGVENVEAKLIPGLTRTENDAATALGVFLVGMLALVTAIALTMHFLSGLPEIMVSGILFAVMVFAVVCGSELMRTELPVQRSGPPQLQFRNPPRKARRNKARPLA